MTEALQLEIRTLRALLDSERDPAGRAFAPLADAYRRAGQIPEALRLLRDGIAKHPDFVTGHVVAAQLYVEQGLTAEGAIAARRALELDGENVNALKSLLRALEETGEAEEAGSVRSTLTTLEPDFTPDWGQTGRAPSGEPPAEEQDDAALAPTLELPAVEPALRDDLPGEVAVDVAFDLQVEEETGTSSDDASVAEGMIDLTTLGPLPLADVSPSALAPDLPESPPEAPLDLELVGLDLPGGLDLPDDQDRGDATEAAEPAIDEAVLHLAADAADEPVLDVAGLAPDTAEDEPAMDLAALAPDPTDEAPVMDLPLLTADDEPVLDLAALAPDAADDEPVLDLAALAPDTADDEPVLDVAALAPGPDDEPVMDLPLLSPDDESDDAVLDVAALAPDGDDEPVMDLAALAPDDEPVMDLAALAPDDEPVMDLATLAPDTPDDEPVMDLPLLSSGDEADEAALDVAALAPDAPDAPDDEPMMELASLAPDTPDDEPVMELATLAPGHEADEAAPMDLPLLTTDDAEEDGVLDVAALAPVTDVDEQVFALDALAPEGEGDYTPTHASGTTAIDAGSDNGQMSVDEAVEVGFAAPDDSDEIVVDLEVLRAEHTAVSSGPPPSGRLEVELEAERGAELPGPDDAAAEASLAAQPAAEPDAGGDVEASTDDHGEPIFTRTLAELYAAQGAVKEAITVLKHLREENPRDESLSRRIAELEAGRSRGPRAEEPEPARDEHEEDHEVETLARDLAESGARSEDVASPFAWTDREPAEDDETGGATIREYFDALLDWEPRDS